MIQSRNSNKVVLLPLVFLSLVGEAGTSTVNFNNDVVSQGKGSHRGLLEQRKRLSAQPGSQGRTLCLSEPLRCYPVAMKGLGVAGEGTVFRTEGTHEQMRGVVR